MTDSVDTWELMPTMHKLIEHALYCNMIVPALEQTVRQMYEADMQSTQQYFKEDRRESAIAEDLASKFG